MIGPSLVSPAVMRFITTARSWMPPLLTAASATDLPERTDHDNTAAVLGSLRSRIAARLAQHRATPSDESRIDTDELSSKNPVRHGYDLGLSDVLALIDDISAQPPLPTNS
ncbi:hypothetical protein [Nocardia abscessus]|uniref:hypothetical protein n=1 Tax=Nocardia abscessus TaxID=120957 RepID=UPI0024556662|nr:hypothetical protein [Nocardia abscessus]